MYGERERWGDIMNIAIITTSLNSGVAERIAGLLSKELSSKYNVYLFLLDTENIVYEYGGTIIDIGRCGPFYEYPIKLYKRKLKIDVAISFLEIMNFANIRTKVNEKVIISERSVQSKIRPFLDAQSLKIKKYYNYADEIVACSYGVKYDLEHNYNVSANIKPIYNFVNKKMILEKSEEQIPLEIQTFLNYSDYLINIGRLHEQKNQRRLIEQFSYYHEKNSNIKLIILGSGELEKELNELIKSKNMIDHIKIVPYTENPFMFIRKAKALIVSSHYEWLPNAIIEAMTIGCPVISTDCLAGPRELLGDLIEYNETITNVTMLERGILVPDLNTDDNLETTYLAQAMDILISNDDIQKNIINRQIQYMTEYNNSDILDKWIDVIEKTRNKYEMVSSEEKELNVGRKNLIYGAGYVGLSYYFRLKKMYNIDGFVVSSKEGYDDFLFGKPIYEFEKLKYSSDEITFIIGVGDNTQDEIVRKLNVKGYKNIIFPYIEPFEYDYYLENNNHLNLKEELCDWYRVYTKLDINIKNPITYNEKIQWLKLNDNLPIKRELADKIKVREYVAKQIGDAYLIPLLGIWNTYDDIDFDKLPDKFALKCNTGSGTNIIVKNKKNINHLELKRKFDEWQSLKYEYKSGLEMHYSGIKPQILAEKLLVSDDGKDLKDYKLFVFNGKVKLIQVDIDRQHFHRRNLYTPDWRYLPYSILYPTAPDIIISKPQCLDELIEVAEKLGQGFIHVRADFYICNEKIYFGELTFTHGSGTEKFTPTEFGVEMGSWMNIHASC